MTLTAIIATAVALLVLGAIVILGVTLLAIAMRKKPAAKAAPAQVDVAVMRQLTQYEIETNEDLAVIADVYREQRTSDRAQMALERLAKIAPRGAATKAAAAAAK